MAKKSNNLLTLKNLMYALAIVAGIVAICMMFVPSVTVEGALGSTTSYTGAEVTFGYSSNDVEYFAFSFMNLLSYILVLVGVVLAVLKLCGIGSSSKLLDIIMIAVFAVGGVFFFLTSSFAIFGELYETANALTTVYTMSIATGAIVAGVLSIVSAALVCVNFVLGSKKK